MGWIQVSNCWGAARAAMVDTWGGGGVHRCLPSRATAATGAAAPVASCLLVPPHFHGLLFDPDGSWEPGDVRGCNNISALHQVFKSGTRLGIINTYTLFTSSGGAKHHGAPWMLASPSLCPSLLSSFQKATVWEESEGRSKDSAGSSELHIIYLHLASA